MAPTGPAPGTPSTAVPPSPHTPPTSAAPTSTAPAGPDRTITVQLWFTRGGKLAPTRRTLPATLVTSRAALTELATGPSLAETATGMTSLIPPGVQVSRIAGQVATLAPPAGFDSGDAATSGSAGHRWSGR